MMSDSVVAIVSDDALPTILSHIHRAGLGHNARVLRPRSTTLTAQLTRAGVPTGQAPERVDDAPALLLVMAAARSPKAADIAVQHGASATWIIKRSGEWTIVDDHVVVDHTVPASDAPRMPIPSVDGDATSESGEPI